MNRLAVYVCRGSLIILKELCYSWPTFLMLASCVVYTEFSRVYFTRLHIE